MSASVLEGTTGVTVEVDTNLDLTPYSALSIIVRAPDSTETEWVAAAKDGDPTTGIMVYTLQSGDVDMPGEYLMHAKVKEAGIAEVYGELTSLRVTRRFGDPYR